MKESFSVYGLEEGQLVCIIDMQGRTLLKQWAMGAQMTISVQQFYRGIYLIKVLSESGQVIHSEKLAIETQVR